MNHRTLAAALLATLLAVAVRADAQGSCTTNGITKSVNTKACSFTIATANASSYTNPKILTLGVSAPTVALTVNTAAFDAGVTPEAAMTLQVAGNRSWVVTASGAATWTSTGALAWSGKPVTDLRWSATAGVAGTPLSTTAVTVLSGNATASSSLTLYWTSALSWALDKPGSYSMPVTLTLTAP